MRFAEFEQAARAVWEEIPEAYKQGVAGLIIDRSAHVHPEQQDVFTLGECVTEEYPSQYGGPDTTRSAVVLYYGSFGEVAATVDEFDWEEEIRETIMHELQHHLESLATEAGLEDFDYAVDENFKRLNGEVFDPLFYRAGEQTGNDTFRVDADVFVEVATRQRDPFSCDFDWDGEHYSVLLPAADADITYIFLDNGPDVGPGEFWLVRVVERGMIATLRAALGRGHTVAELTVHAEIS